jgi:heat shock factor-binding protein 1
MESKTATPSTSTTTSNLPLNQMDTPEDLDLFVKELMDSMQTRFSRLSDTILGRIDDMGSKIDDLEKSIGELMDQAGIDPNSSGEGKKSDS